MKKLIAGIILIIVCSNFHGCTITNAVQIKNLKDEMTIVKARLDSLEIKINQKVKK